MRKLIDQISKLQLNEHIGEVLRGSSTAFALKVAGTAFGLISSILIAKILGPKGTGLYFLAANVVTIAVVIGYMGLGGTLVRFAAVNASTKNWEAVKGMYHQGVVVSLITSLLMTLVVYLTAPFLADIVFSVTELKNALQLMAISIVPMVMISLHADLLKGIKKIRDSQLVEVLYSRILYSLSLIGLFYFYSNLNITQVIGFYNLTVALTAFIGYTLWRKATPQLQGIKGIFNFSHLIASSLSLLWGNIIYCILPTISTFILGIWNPASDVGLFSIASRMALLTTFIYTSNNAIIAPKFAELYQQQKIKTLKQLSKSSAQIMIITASPFLLIFIFAPQLPVSFFGSEFMGASIPLAILSLGQLVNLATGPAECLLVMTGNEKVWRNNITIAGTMTVLINLIMIPWLGLIGAALAATISQVCANLISLYSIWKHLKIVAIPFF